MQRLGVGVGMGVSLSLGQAHAHAPELLVVDSKVNGETLLDVDLVVGARSLLRGGSLGVGAGKVVGSSNGLELDVGALLGEGVGLGLIGRNHEIVLDLVLALLATLLDSALAGRRTLAGRSLLCGSLASLATGIIMIVGTGGGQSGIGRSLALEGAGPATRSQAVQAVLFLDLAVADLAAVESVSFKSHDRMGYWGEGWGGGVTLAEAAFLRLEWVATDSQSTAVGSLLKRTMLKNSRLSTGVSSMPVFL